MSKWSDNDDLYLDIWDIFEKYHDLNTDPDPDSEDSFDDCDLSMHLYDTAKGIYDKDSEVWMKYAYRPISDPEKVAAISAIDNDQQGIFEYVLTGPRPSIDKVNRGLSMIVEIKAVLDKGVLCGYYTEDQAIALTGGMLKAFDHVLDLTGLIETRATFYNTPQAVALYQKIWQPYVEKFPQRIYHWKKRPSPNVSTEKPVPRPLPKEEKLTGKEKAGLALFGLASLPLGVVGFILFLIPWVIAILIWIGCFEFLKGIFK